MDQVTQDLQTAYDILEERGWCQGHFADDGKVCLDGALIQAISPNSRVFVVEVDKLRRYNTAARRILQSMEFVSENVQEEAIWDFNDNVQTTVEDVKLTLKKAIALGRDT
jgi:hypothetical protein